MSPPATAADTSTARSSKPLTSAIAPHCCTPTVGTLFRVLIQRVTRRQPPSQPVGEVDAALPFATSIG